VRIVWRAREVGGAEDPSKLGGRSRSRPQEEPINVERARAMDFGVAVHGALEAVELQQAWLKQRKQIEQFLALAGLSDEDKRRAVEIASSAIGSELLVRARNAEQVYRELPLRKSWTGHRWKAK